MKSAIVDELIDSIEALDVVAPGKLTLAIQRLSTEDVQLLAERVYHENREQSWKAAVILSYINHPVTLDTMRQLLTANHPFLGHIAFDTLERYAPTEDSQTFVKALPQSIATLQPRLVRLIEKRGDRRAIPTLMALLPNATSSLLRLTIIQALGVLGDDEVREVIEGYIEDDDHHVRKRAMIALEQLTSSER